MTTRAASPLLLLCVAQFVLQLDFSIVNIALRTIASELGFSAAGLQWVVTGYALSFGSLLLLGGRLGDVLGRRRLLLTGLWVFGAASVVCGLATSPVMLVAARFVQGIGAALMAPTIIAMLTAIYADGPARTRALGLWTAATAAGGVSGIVAGGVLTQYLGWRSIFLVNIPLIAVLLPAARRMLPEVPGDRCAAARHGRCDHRDDRDRRAHLRAEQRRAARVRVDGLARRVRGVRALRRGVRRDRADGRGTDAPVLVPRGGDPARLVRRDARGRRGLRGVRVLRRPLPPARPGLQRDPGRDRARPGAVVARSSAPRSSAAGRSRASASRRRCSPGSRRSRRASSSSAG